jgi:ATP-dependent Clp protease adapter protein ClpS
MPQGIDLLPAVLPDEAVREEETVEPAIGPPDLDRPYIVILYNCDCHTFDDVERQLQKATGCSLEKAEALAVEVDSQGRAVVYSGEDIACERVAGCLREIGLQVETDRQ